MKKIATLLFMILGMISYSQKNLTSFEHMVITTSFEQESHIEDCYFTIKDSVVIQTNKTRDSVIHSYKIGVPQKDGEIETTLKLRKYSNDSFDIELNEYYSVLKRTSKVLYYIEW